MACNGFIILIFLIAIISPISNAVKVNMQGSLRFGEDVINMLKNYINYNYYNFRRSSLSYDPKEENIIHSIVNSIALCRNLDLCAHEFSEFITRYVTRLATAVHTIFDGLINGSNRNEGLESIVGVPKYEQKLKYNLKQIKDILKNANNKFTDDNETYTWVDVVKKICAKIQETAILFVTERLVGNTEYLHEVKKATIQQIVTETIAVEEEFLIKLCTEHNVCSKSYECTKALNTLMTSFKTMDNDKVKTFVRVFYEILPDTALYTKLSEITVNEFQTVLNDMAFSDKAPTKDVLLTVQNIVENRLNLSANNNYTVVKGRDVGLVHVILSDMDHIYSKSKAEPFYKRLSAFNEWTKGDVRLNSIMRQTMNDISNQISLQSDDLIFKLTNEVRVFLEITIDPEK